MIVEKGGVCAFVLLVGCLLCSGPSDARAQSSDSDALIRAVAMSGSVPFVRNDTVYLAVGIQMRQGIHINANPPSEDWLLPVEVATKGVAGIVMNSVAYPAGVEKQFSFYPAVLKVYDGTIVTVVRLVVHAGTPPGWQELKVVIRYQACSNVKCFRPAELTLAIPVEVAEEGTAAAKTTVNSLRATITRVLNSSWRLSP